MDQWQKNIIRKSFPGLLESTICTTQFLMELLIMQALSYEDVVEIGSTQKQLDKSKKLYDFLMTRHNGYSSLIKALFKCKLMEAVKLLFHAHLHHYIELPNVDFRGKVVSLRDHFPQFDNQDLQEILENTPLNDNTIDFICGSAVNLKLCYDTIPPIPKFYIPRSISNRLQIHPGIFKEKCEDVFVFANIDKSKLSEIVHPNFVLPSYQRLSEIISNFILLEQRSDWLTLRKTPDRPIHLIQYEGDNFLQGPNSETYILEETVGNSKILHNFLKSSNKRACVSEDELLSQAEVSASGICIYEEPDMEKSWVLPSLARNASLKHPERFVGFIALSELSKHLKLSDTNITCLSATNLVLDSIATSVFSKRVLERALHKDSLSMELFFDGLDEVPSDHVGVTIEFLKALLSKKTQFKIYVTSKPHVQRKLEKDLGMIACRILPFTELNKKEFLVNSWKQKLINYEKAKLNQFAISCLQKFGSMFYFTERDIMGIPLQCFRLAERHANEARIYSDPGYNLKTPRIKSTSIYDMYKSFVDERFESVEFSSFRMPQEEKVLAHLEFLSTNKMKVYHLAQALLLLFPKQSDEFGFLMLANEEMPTSLNFSFRIREQVNSGNGNVSKFVNRSYAEFLVAEFVGDILTGKYKSSPKFYDMLKFCFNYALDIRSFSGSMCFRHSVIVTFIDMYLGSTMTSIVHPLVAETFEVFIPPYSLRVMLSICARSGYLYLLRFIKNTLVLLPKEKLNIYRPFVICKDECIDREEGTEIDHCEKHVKSTYLLWIAVESGNSVEFLDELFQLFQDCFGYNTELALFLDNPLNAHLPFVAAVQVGNKEIVEYLGERFSLEGRNLLYKCMLDKYSNPGDENIRARKRVLKTLIYRNNALIYELPVKNFQFEYKAYGCLNLEIVKCLFEEVKSVIIEEKLRLIWQSEVLVNCAMLLKPKDYLELIQFLLNNCKTSSTEKDSLQYCLTAVINFIDINEYTMLLHAVNINQPLGTIKELVKFGASFHYKNRITKENVLHFAAQNKNEEMIEYFLSLGLSLNEKDMKGETPLLRASKSFKFIKYLVEKGADVRASNTYGETIAHKAAVNMYSADDFHELVVLISQKWSAADILFQTSKQIYLFFRYKQPQWYNLGTPLHIRLHENCIHIKTLRLMLEGNRFVNANTVLENHATLLHAAVERQPVSILKELVTLGVDYDLRTKDGNLLDFAIRSERDEAIQYFQSLGLKTWRRW